MIWAEFLTKNLMLNQRSYNLLTIVSFRLPLSCLFSEKKKQFHSYF